MKMKLVVRATLMIFLVSTLCTIFTIPPINAIIVWKVPGDYEKIQWAVGNATAGDTIIVDSGIYEESVNVTTPSLIIKANITATTARAVSNAIIEPPNGQNCITINADNVTIDGFELTNTTGGDGIELEGSNNTIRNNLIHDMRRGIVCWDYDGNSSNNKISNNTIYDCTAHGILYGACTLNAVNEKATVFNNTIYNCGAHIHASSLKIVNGKGFIVSMNNITGNPSQHYGILICSWNAILQGNHTLSGNAITGHHTGISIIADLDGGTDQGLSSVSNVTIADITIDGNDISKAKYHGIDLCAIPNENATVTDCTISNNTVHDNGENGVYVRTYAQGNKVVRNTITRNKHGLKISGNRTQVIRNRITNNTGPGGCGIYLPNDTEGIKIHCNYIMGNSPPDSDSFGIFNNGTTLANATHNYWGHRSGPYPTGLGDRVSDNVEFEPWLRVPADINLDGIVNLYDLVHVAAVYGSKLGDPNWSSEADVAPDGVINIYDIVSLLPYYGKTCPS